MFCCNNKIINKKSKIRVCKKCFEKSNPPKPELESNSSAENSNALSNEKNCKENASSNDTSKNEPVSQETASDDNDDDKCDINFEVRAEKLNSNSNESFGDIYSTANEQKACDAKSESKLPSTQRIS